MIITTSIPAAFIFKNESEKTMKKVLFIGTGGTIASELSDGTLSPAMSASQLLKHIPNVSKICRIDAIQPFALDSTNITPEHWLCIAEEIEKAYDNYDGFVIAHGTDTLAYTAAALSYLIQESRKPIVITGAQKPIGFETTDSKQNLTDSFICASSELCGVYVVFSGLVLVGCRARKTRSKSFSAFSSPNFPTPAIVQNNKLIEYFKLQPGETKIYKQLDPSVGLIKLSPGMKANVFQYTLQQYKAVVIEAFGVGGLPDYDSIFRNAVKSAVSSGKTVVITTQAQNEGTDTSVYAVSSDLTDIGVLEAFDMTTEACITKLMWILAQSNDPEIRRKLFYTPVYHDIIPANRML